MILYGIIWIYGELVDLWRIDGDLWGLMVLHGEWKVINSGP